MPPILHQLTTGILLWSRFFIGCQSVRSPTQLALCEMATPINRNSPDKPDCQSGASMSRNSLDRSRGDLVGSGKPKEPLGLTPREAHGTAEMPFSLKAHGTAEMATPINRNNPDKPDCQSGSASRPYCTDSSLFIPGGRTDFPSPFFRLSSTFPASRG
ncbi:hypothetical protein CRG98_014961 [Punica granatum]|uniref:Uncharacterized protein n=1 Tax=Punica granatum TaxID=22663 RepID=A0A2I0K7W7_PUNGR|nr:hypothetical protein CRG98_014961 [Punica granatum]